MRCGRAAGVHWIKGLHSRLWCGACDVLHTSRRAPPRTQRARSEPLFPPPPNTPPPRVPHSPGDGAGILAAMPDGFFGTVMEAAGVRLPPAGQYAVGQVFLPQDEQQRDAAKRVMEAVAAELGHEVLAWRRVPTDNRSLGASAVKVEPVVEQWFVSADGAKHRQLDAEGQVGVWGGAVRGGAARGVSHCTGVRCHATALARRTWAHTGSSLASIPPCYFRPSSPSSPAVHPAQAGGV